MVWAWWRVKSGVAEIKTTPTQPPSPPPLSLSITIPTAHIHTTFRYRERSSHKGVGGGEGRRERVCVRAVMEWMMEGVAMLRQLIGQLQEVLELYGSPPPTVPSNYFIQFQPTSHHQPLRSLLISPFFLLIFGFLFSCFEWRGFGFYFHFYKLFHFCFWVRLSSSKPIFCLFPFVFL